MVKIIDYRSRRLGEQLTDSFMQTGFAVLINHPIKKELIDNTYTFWSKFFETARKFDYLFDEKTQAGYFPFRSENADGYSAKDLKEFFHLFYPFLDVPNFYGKSDPNTKLLATELNMLGLILLRELGKVIPLNYNISLEEIAFGAKNTLLRIIHYPPLGHSTRDLVQDGAVRAAPHEDINLITLLPVATKPGLQIKDKNDQWHDVPSDPHAIIINVGDMLQELTDGFLKSTTHRVINPTGEDATQSRYSMPMFIHPHAHTRLSSRYTAQEYLDERLKNIGLKK